jgi:hypothetical protein
MVGYAMTDFADKQVILPACEFRLPEVLRHLEAGRTVLVILASTDGNQQQVSAIRESDETPIQGVIADSS